MNKKSVMQEASYGERGNTLSPSQCAISHCQRIENRRSFGGGSLGRRAAEGEKPMEGKFQRQRRGEQKRVLQGSGLLFLAFSVNYVLNKAKVLYHNFCACFNHPRMEIETSLVDAYFSIPVASATISTVPYAV